MVITVFEFYYYRSQVVCPDCLWPTAYIIHLFFFSLPVHLLVPMATSTSIVIKQLQQRFVVWVKGALCVLHMTSSWYFPLMLPGV